MIMACSPEGILAIDGSMPWSEPEDLRRFKTLTTNNVIIYGRKTFESFNCNPLPQRKNYIISRSLSSNIENNYTSLFYDIESAISTARLLYENKTIYIAGGASIYEQTLPIVDEIELTIINKERVNYKEGTKTMFPNWGTFRNNFKEETFTKSKTCEYITYKRKPISYINKIGAFFL